MENEALWKIYYLLQDIVLNDASTYSEGRAYQLELIAKAIHDSSTSTKIEEEK